MTRDHLKPSRSNATKRAETEARKRAGRRPNGGSAPVGRGFFLPADLAEALVEYIASKPYREVAMFMQALNGLPTVEASEVKDEETDDADTDAAETEEQTDDA